MELKERSKTYADVAEPVDNLSSINIRVEWHVEKEDVEDDLFETRALDYLPNLLICVMTYDEYGSGINERPASSL